MYIKFLAVAAMAASCLIGSVTMAQDAPQAETSPPVVAAETNTAVPVSVPKGTPIIVEITDLVSTKTANRDDMFNLKLAEPITLNGAVVIPEGTPGKGQVIDAAKPGMGGKPGKLVLAARYLEFEGRQIPIRGLNLNLSAKDNSGSAVVVSAAVGVFGLLVTGGDMEVQPGTHAHAKLGVDFVPADAVAPPSAMPVNGTIDPSSTLQNSQ